MDTILENDDWNNYNKTLDKHSDLLQWIRKTGTKYMETDIELTIRFRDILQKNQKSYYENGLVDRKNNFTVKNEKLLEKIEFLINEVININPDYFKELKMLIG